MSEPSEIQCGASAKWERSSAGDYTIAAGYDLEYHAAGPDRGVKIDGAARGVARCGGALD